MPERPSTVLTKNRASRRPFDSKIIINHDDGEKSQNVKNRTYLTKYEPNLSILQDNSFLNTPEKIDSVREKRSKSEARDKTAKYMLAVPPGKSIFDKMQQKEGFSRTSTPGGNMDLATTAKAVDKSSFSKAVSPNSNSFSRQKTSQMSSV